jgi:Ca-activated chloride channel family protein
LVDFRFAYIPVFLLLIPTILLTILWWRGQSNRISPVLRYSDTRLLAGLPVGVRLRLRRLPDILRLLAWFLLLIALARPQSGSGEELLRGRGIDIVMALDISQSMAVPDFNGLTRFDAAREVIRDFIDGRTYDRIGLVVFAEDAFYQAPATLDYPILIEIMENVPLAGDIGLSNKTALGLGMATATNMLRKSTAPSRVIILVTDGANNAGEIDPISAAQAAAAFGIRIYTIGMGTADDSENSLDEPTLLQIASITDARYFNALNLSDLQNVYEQINRLERSPVERRLNIRWQDQAWSFMIAALVLLWLERIMRHTIFQTIP